MSRLWIQLAAAVLFALAWMQSSRLEPKHEYGVFSIDPPTPFIHYLPDGIVLGRVLVVHGLDVSKETMRITAAGLADGGFEVYVIDLPGHGDSSEKFAVAAAEKAITDVVTYLGTDTIVLGHSLGAGLLLDLSANQHFSTMVLLSPPPMPIPDIHADRVLVATGNIDIPRIRAFVPIVADIGNPKVESWLLRWGGHSTPIYNPEHISRIVDWLGGKGSQSKTAFRLFWILLMFTSGAVLGCALMPASGMEYGPSSLAMTSALIRYVAACGLAAVILKFLNPVSWLHLFATDYLIGFMLLTGVILFAVAPQSLGSRLFAGGYGVLLTAPFAAAYTVVMFGFIASAHLVHFSLSDNRWWRFPCIAAASLPLFLADEFMIRNLQSRVKSMLTALITRNLLLAFLLVGVLILNRENAFLVLLAPVITLFWIALWFATGVVYRNTQSPVASALFAALVQGWVFAALFVTI